MSNRCIPSTIHTIRALDNFSAWLIKKMEEADITCEELAKEIGCERKSVQRWRSKASYPRLDQLAAVYHYFDEDWIQIPIYK